MTCRSVRARFARHQDGDLPADQAGAVEEHLRECETCRRECAALRGTVALLDGLGELEPSAGFTSSVLQAVREERIAEPARPPVSAGLALAGLGAVLSTIIVAGLCGFGPLDLSGWQLALPSLATATAKLCAVMAEVSGPALSALLEGLARPAGWLLAADVLALLVVLAGGRRLLARKTLRGMTNLLAL